MMEKTTEEDLPQIQIFVEEFLTYLGNTQKISLEEVKKRELGENFISRIYKIDDKIVGWINAEIKNENKIIINNIFTNPEHRKHGIGQKLMNDILSNPTLFELYVNKSNPMKEILIKFYEKNGFKMDYETSKRYYLIHSQGSNSL